MIHKTLFNIINIACIALHERVERRGGASRHDGVGRPDPASALRGRERGREYSLCILWREFKTPRRIIICTYDQGKKVMSTSWRPWLGNEENNTTPEHTEFNLTPRTDQDPATEMESQSQESRIKGIERVDQKLSR